MLWLAGAVLYYAGCLAVLGGWAAGLNRGEAIHWLYVPLIPLGLAVIVASPLLTTRLMGRKPSVGSAIAIMVGLLFAVQIAYAVMLFGGAALDALF